MDVLEGRGSKGGGGVAGVQAATEVEALTLESVKSLAKEYLHHDQMIYLVVGDAKTQLPRLKALGLGKPVLINAG